jgi:hypothetical protein
MEVGGQWLVVASSFGMCEAVSCLVLFFRGAREQIWEEQLLNLCRDSCALDRLTADSTGFSRTVAVISLSQDQRESMSDHRLMIRDRRPTEPFDGLGLTTSAHDWWPVVFPVLARSGRAEGL